MGAHAGFRTRRAVYLRMMQSADAISPGPDDGRLLAVWRSDQNAEAFAQVVRRHAPMVFGVCRSILGDGPDAHDATQAVFLALVRKAASLEHHPTLAGWLHRVACYVSIQARRAAAVRRRHEREAARMRSTDTAGSPDLPADLLHEAIGALADKYRVPLVLHHLEGRSEEEIASLLGCSLGTLSSRLSRGRQKLRQRLTKPGAGVTAGVMAAALTQSATAAAEPLPAALLTSLVHMPVGVLAGQASAAVASTSAVALSKGAIHMLFMAKMKLAALMTAAAMLVIGGAGVTTYVALGAAGQTPSPAASRPVARVLHDVNWGPRADEGETRNLKLDVHGDPLPPEAVSRLGTVRFRHVGGGTHQPISSLALSGDGLRAVTTAEWEATLRFWDTQTGAPVAAIKMENTHSVAQVALSPDGKKVYAIVTGNRDPATHFYGSWLIGWDVGTGAEVVHLDDAVAPLGISRDGTRAAMASRQATDAIQVIDLATGKTAGQFKGHAAPKWASPGVSAIKALVWSDDGKLLCSAAEDNQAVVWDVATGQAIKKLAGNQIKPPPVAQGQGGQGQRDVSMPVFPSAISPDNTLLATADLNCTIVRRINDGKVLHTIKPTDPPLPEGADPAKQPIVKRSVGSIVFSPDGKLLATGSTDRVICLYDLEKGAMVQELHHHAQPQTLAFSRDGKTLWFAGDKTVYALDVATCKLRFDHAGPESVVTRVLFSPDGKRIAVLDWLGDLRLYDAASSKQIWSTPAHPNPGGFRPAEGAMAMACVFRPDGKELFTGGGDHKINCWDPETGKLIRLIGEVGRIGAQGLPGCASDMAITPDGKTLLLNRGFTASLVSTSADEQNGGAALPTPVKTGGTYCNVAFTGDGKIAVAGLGSSGTRVFAWNRATAESIAAWEARTEHVSQQPNTSIEARPTSDGRVVVAVTNGYHDIFAWNLASGQQLLSRRLFDAPQRGPHWVSMRLTPDDRLALVSVGNDIVAVELLSGSIVRRYEGHRAYVTTLDVSPDGRRLASGSMDATVLTWDLPVPDPARPTADSKPTADELPKLWETLAGEDAAAAWRAATRMALAGSDASAFLGQRIAPVKAEANQEVWKRNQEIWKLIADLNSDDVRTRDRAKTELTKLGQAAFGPLKAALDENPGAQAEARICDLLGKLAPPSAMGQAAGAQMQQLRTVAVLEWAGDEAARKLLSQLADGAPGVLTDQAAAALNRLKSRP